MIRHSETAEQIDRTVTEIDSVANALMPPSSLSSLLTSSTGPELVDISWKRPGVPASVAATLRGAKPTKTQTQLIPAILSTKDVLLQDHTGTGKYAEFHTAGHASDQLTELQVI